jgi:hypothetical protein
MAEVIAHKLTLSAKLAEGAREFRHMSLLRLAEDKLAAAGINVRCLSGIEIAPHAMHSTSDFPLILANGAKKRLRDIYLASPSSYGYGHAAHPTRQISRASTLCN